MARGAQADINMDFDSDTTGAQKEVRRLQDRVKKLEGGLGGVRQKSQRAGGSLDQSFGNKALGNLRSYIGGLVGITAAIGLVTTAMRDMRRMEQLAGQRIVDEVTGRRALAQLPADFKMLVAGAEMLRREHGMKAGPAYGLTAAAESAEQFRNLALYGSLKEIAFPGKAGVTAVQKIQAAFGGTGADRMGGGIARQIINKVLIAAGPSPVMAGRIAEASAITSAAFAAIGGQDEALLAMLAVLSKTFQTPRAAAEKIKGLSLQVMKKRHLIRGAKGLEGMDLFYALPGLAQRGMLYGEGGEQVTLTKFLAEANALQAMEELMKQRGDIQDQRRLIAIAERETGGAKDVFAARIERTRADVQLEAVRLREKAEQDRWVQEEEKYAEPANLAQAYLDELIRIEREAGIPEYEIWMKDKSRRFQRWIRGNEDYLLSEGYWQHPETGVSEGLVQALEKLADGVERMPEETGRAVRENIGQPTGGSPLVDERQ